MRAAFLVLAAFALLAHGRQLLTPDLAASPLGGSQGVLNLTDPDVKTWAGIFNRYYNLSTTLAQRPGGNKTVSYETIFLLANAALSAAAAKSVETALNASSPSQKQHLQETISYSQQAGKQAVSVAESPAARNPALLNITAYTQIAGESAVDTGIAAASGNDTAAIAAAGRAVVAAGDGLFQAEDLSAPPPSNK